MLKSINSFFLTPYITEKNEENHTISSYEIMVATSLKMA